MLSLILFPSHDRSVLRWYENEWNKIGSHVKPDYDQCKDFLNEIWWKRKLKKAPRNDKDKRQLCRNLVNWINGKMICDW